jgi:hypothetical protein
MEVWKDIPGYEGLYQASDQGNIRTAEGKITSNKRYATRRWKSRVLKGRGNNPKTGKRVALWKDGTPKDWLVARLVAITFLGNPPNGFTVNHKDGNRMNNNIENLEWLSLADNIKHGFANGLYPTKAVKLVCLTNEGVFEFASMSSCDKFLKRRKGYTSESIINNRWLYDSDGNKYCGLVGD